MYLPKFTELQYAEIDSPDAIDDQTGGATGYIYYGYCRGGGAVGTTYWSIRRATVGATTIIYEWAGRKHKYDLIWNDRAEYTYGFIR